MTASVLKSIGSILMIALILGLLIPLSVEGESPPNLSGNIPWTDTGGTYDPDSGIYDASFNGVVDIESAFNNGRRQEEIQFGLSTDFLGNLVLPDQSVWDIMTPDEKAMLIMNSERIVREEMAPGVLGYPFNGVQADVHDLAQYYSDYLVDHNAWGHSEDGFTPYERIDNDPVLGPCHEFLYRAENIAAFWTSGSSNPLPVERAIYMWVYADAGSSWGHRETVLLQDKDLQNQNPFYGFNDNVGLSMVEGFIGIGLSESPDYDPFGWGWVNMGTVVVFNYIDPVSTGSCPWDLTPTPACLNHGDVTGDGNVTAEDAQQAFAIALEMMVPTFEEACAADCNSDGSVTAGDAQQIFGVIFGGSCVDPVS